VTEPTEKAETPAAAAVPDAAAAAAPPAEKGAAVRIPPPLVFLAAIVFGWLIPALDLHGYLWIRLLLGLPLLAGGLAVGLPAIRQFRRTGQDPAPWEPKSLLILVGPYRRSRNPMYVSMVMITLGVGALAARGWIGILAWVAFAVVHFSAVLPEERYLTEKFGDNYIEYKNKVMRYL
jgi:protein-S-isoprenylcysteine O-methyltransferase Ste14